ncbi:Hypothetical protein PHPALM_13326, partial [Phytophthora palmivora]
MAVEANDESGTDAWTGVLTDAVAKCGRDSDRRLYMYGISSNRCPKCQTRLHADSNTCASCHYTHKTPRKCTRCSLQNSPVMWCAECDAYFCATCHKKPHVLMLGSTKPHHCFVIDGASGKHFVEAAWSDEFTAMVQATYRLRLHDKMLADEAKASTKATGQQTTPALNGAADQAASVSLSTQTQSEDTPASTHLPVAQAETNEGLSTSTEAPSSTNGSGQPSSSTSLHSNEQSRKRQLPGPDDTRNKIQKATRTNEFTRSSGAAPPNGMNLYDRVKAMHDMRAKASQLNTQQAPSPKMNLTEILSKENEERQRQKHNQVERDNHKADQAVQQRRQDVERIERWMMEKEQNELKQQEERRRQLDEQQQEQRRKDKERQQEEQRRHEEQRQQEERRQQEKLRQHEEQRQREEQRRHKERLQQKRIQDQQRQQRLMEERIRHEQILRQQEESRLQAEARS